ncbi:hypothetical protein UJ101_01002 [Flavobacteriaceae bacterium UJ101]|nr:hypothetical protein UJ101_01002 [Flavobacteriaceae bacterium UJ101]
MIKTHFYIFLIFLINTTVFSQELKTKIDLKKNVYHRNRWDIATSFRAEHIFSQNWTRLSLKETTKYYISPNLDAVGGVDVKYLFEKDFNNIFELRPFIGVQYHAFLIKNIDMKQQLLFENRNLFSSITNKSNLRSRFKVEFDYSISENNDFKWLIPIYFEWFIEDSDQIQDRYISNNSMSIGLIKKQLKKKSQWKLEYVLHKTRNIFTPENDDEYISEIGIYYLF